jgi:beta-glucosidase
VLGAATDDGLRLWLDGKLVIDRWVDRGTTLDRLTLKLEAGRQYDLKMEFYENTGYSYASLVWALTTGVDSQIKAAEDAARKARVAVVVAGIAEGEGYDRSSLDLPGEQERLINAVTATGTPTVVVLINGAPVTMAKWITGVSAVVDAWYGGEEAGNAVADVLFGDKNPGGKLPITFPQTVGQVPLFYGHKPTGRGDAYVDMSDRPLYPFGHGLSYTTFDYSELKLSPGTIAVGGTCAVSFSVKNSGSVAGDEVVQLYIHQPYASVTRPVKELAGFSRVSLAPGETKKVAFELTRAHLAFLNAQMKLVMEPGTVEVLVGSSSEDIRLKGTFEIR